MAAHGARRLQPMAENACAVIGIELLAAAQACEFHRPLASSAPLEAAITRLRNDVARLEADRFLHPDIAAATALVRGGEIVAAVGDTPLPALEGASR